MAWVDRRGGDDGRVLERLIHDAEPTGALPYPPDVLVAFVFAEVEAGDRLGSMALYFLVAMVVVGPYAVVRVRRIFREKAERAALLRPVDEVSPEQAEATAAAEATARSKAEDDLGGAIDAIEAGRDGRDEQFEVRIPTHPRINGRPADPATAEVLVQDALRRSGIVVISEDSSPDGRVLTCRRGSTLDAP